MSRAFPLRVLVLPAAVVVATLGVTAVPGLAGGGTGHSARGAGAREQAYAAGARASSTPPSATHTPDDGNLADRSATYAFERSAPAQTVSGAALIAAQAQAAALPTTGGSWIERTLKAYNAEPAGYTDPFWSNIGAGFGVVGGRTTSLVATSAGTWFAGTADGGVWRSTNAGVNWTPVFDSQATQSIGTVTVAPDGAIWVGTGEANTNSDSYAGTGVYRSTDQGGTWSPVRNGDGSNPMVGRTVYRIAFASGGTELAATSDGLWRYDGTTWTDVLATPQVGDPNPYYNDQVTDVQIVPGTSGARVIAAIGWRGPLTGFNQNGFFASTDGGQTFAAVTETGINAADIGRTTFAYSADGTKLYAVVESPAALSSGAESVLQGVYVTSGTTLVPASPAGPWALIGDEAKLSASGSALAVGSGYGVGVQAWYNQFLTVDPANASHVYLGLEEVFESTNAGSTWVTASPYWNYGLACNPNCAKVTHPDQHAVMVTGSQVVIGNDGGIYSRPVTDHNQNDGWNDLNATLHNLQYYDAAAGKLGKSTAIWGGLQDNGTSLLDPGQPQMVEPAGGDGGAILVNPANANQMVGEYVDLTMYSSTDGGHTFNSFVSPGCTAQSTVGLTPLPGCDPSARFIAPFVANQTDVNTWVAGGRYVWVSKDGWNTSCTSSGCSWTNQFDTGSGNVVTALSAAKHAIYAAWVHGSGNPSGSFAVGLATNVGGWHQISMTGLPNRYIAGVTADPKNPKHAIAVFNGYSRRWVPGGGVGHVFETWSAGASWTDISGNLPDVPGDALVLTGSTLVLATDIGAFTATDSHKGVPSWSRLGSGLPNVSVNNVTLGPDGGVYAATHGRGIWRLAL